jgi:hypothetical protein
MGIKSSCGSDRWPRMAIVGGMRDDDCLAFHGDGGELRDGTASRSRGGLLRGGGLGVERPADDAALPRTRGSRLPSPYGTAHRAGLTERRPRATRSILPCPRSRFAYRSSYGALCRSSFPLWVSAARPGSPHDLTTARGLLVLARKGADADVGVHMPVKHQPDGPRHTDKRTW